MKMYCIPFGIFGDFLVQKVGIFIPKFFFNLLFWTTYKTFHALFKKEKLLLICIRSSPHELCVYTQKMMILCKCVNNKNCCFMNKVECDYIFLCKNVLYNLDILVGFFPKQIVIYYNLNIHV